MSSVRTPTRSVSTKRIHEGNSASSTTPTLLGTFNVRCAELCGLNHSYMETTATVMNPDDFNSWIQSHGGNPGQHVAEEASNG